MMADAYYQQALSAILDNGEVINTRNSWTYSHIAMEPITFTRTPLITLRHTAWKLAIREMEWFMSGEAKCPPELLPWWKNQLNEDDCYLSGYSEQFRYATGDHIHDFDQVHFILEGLRHNANSRRLVMTSWNPYDMANITKKNNNPNCPTTCHSSMVQFFVRNETLYMTSYQRSADMLLGVPHNWIQSWALLLWFAHHSKLKVGHLRWILGDAHIYCHETHMQAANEIIACNFNSIEHNTFNLRYQPQNDSEVFRAKDFFMEGFVPAPMVFVKPALL